MEDTDGGLHPAVDGQSLDEIRWVWERECKRKSRIMDIFDKFRFFNWLERRENAEQIAKKCKSFTFSISELHSFEVLHDHFTYLWKTDLKARLGSTHCNLNLEFFQASVWYQTWSAQFTKWKYVMNITQNYCLEKNPKQTNTRLFKRLVNQNFYTKKNDLHLIK